MSRKVPFVFNPALLKPDELRSLFVARHAERDQILQHLRAAGSSPQHVLVVGERGMGKTTLLLRVAYSLDEEPGLGRKWLAVRFDEEQYNLGELADFWLNCLEKIGEETGDPAPLREVDELVRSFKGQELREAAFLRLRQYSVQHNQRLLLLVDNFDLLLARLHVQEVRRLREVLQSESWLLLVGASANPVVFDYDSPFYDFFHGIYLEPLAFEETLSFLLKLGTNLKREAETARLLESRRSDLSTLHALIGGNLRTVTLLFSLLDQEPRADLKFLLDRLLDQYTSSYKDAVEALAPQGQRVFDALARAWDPTTADEVSRDLRIERGVASAQLHRLAERGLVVKVQLPQRSLGFQVRDRLFNLWYLMRGGRRQRPSLQALLSFLKLFYPQPGNESGREEILARVRRLHLLTEEFSAQVGEASSEEAEAQGNLFMGSSSIRKKYVDMLLTRHDDDALEEAKRYLRGHQDDGLVRELLALSLERRGDAAAAIEVLAEARESQGLPAWQSAEQARILLAQGEFEKAEPILKALLGSNGIEAEDLASLAVGWAQTGPRSQGWLAEGLIHQALQHGEARADILLAACQVELALDHPKQALERFREALAAAGSEAGQSRAILQIALRLASSHPKEVLDALKESGLSHEWLPMAHALAFLGGESERLEKLSPEMRTFTNMVIAAVPNAAAAAGSSS
jgi:tetratricopeptide (TPR) repeat protein